jgi:hypothetical protein
MTTPEISGSTTVTVTTTTPQFARGHYVMIGEHQYRVIDHSNASMSSLTIRPVSRFERWRRLWENLVAFPMIDVTRWVRSRGRRRA